MSKIRLEDIQSALKEQNWSVLSDEYVNLDSEMEFECPEGHKVISTWKKFRIAPRCPICEQSIEFSSKPVQPKKKGTHRVLAVDQATKVSGYAIFDNGELVKYGVFSTTKSEAIERCAEVKNWLISIINLWHPDFVGFEDIQFQEESEGRRMGVTVFQALAQLQGILMETCYELKIPFTLCATNTWRHYCGVKGRARTDKKRSMQLLAKQWYNVSANEDEADAIGIGRYAASLYKPIETVNWE